MEEEGGGGGVRGGGGGVGGGGGQKTIASGTAAAAADDDDDNVGRRGCDFGGVAFLFLLVRARDSFDAHFFRFFFLDPFIAFMTVRVRASVCVCVCVCVVCDCFSCCGAAEGLVGC